MHGYRLTRRGKFVLTMLVILSLASTLNLRKIAIASDNSGYEVHNATYFSSPYSEVDKLDLSKLAVVFNTEVNELDDGDKENSENKEEFLSINVEDIKTYNKSKVVFLTFDDGPSDNVTPLILDILDEYKIKATFFVLGSMCEKNGAVLSDIYHRGHAIGNHSYSHNFKELYKNEESFLNELKMTEDAIGQNLGEEFSTRLFRFPGGAFEGYKMQYMGALNKEGYVSVDWNAVTGDAEVVTPTPERILERLKATVKNKSNVVLLLHDSATKQATVQVLPDVIKYLKSEGYEFAILK